MNRKQTAVYIILVLSLVQAACGLGLPGLQSEYAPSHTAAAQTVVAIGTTVSRGRTATPCCTPGPTEPPTAVVRSLTPTLTAVPSATYTLTPRSETPGAACNRAEFVRDVTVNDGTELLPDTTFVKTWEIRNAGSCSWNTGYSVIYVAGDQMGGPSSAPLVSSGSVEPGETVQVSVTLQAPAGPGEYRGDWRLRSDDNKIFGIGENNATFYVKIRVGQEYRFAEHYCSARWSSAAGPELPCPGETGDYRGYVRLVERPTMEDNVERDTPGLLAAPEPVSGGYLVGRFPPVVVPPQSDFRAELSCPPDSPGCYVRFKVTYQIDDGGEQFLKEWNDGYEGLTTFAAADLDDLAGKPVAFNLYVYVTGDPQQSKGLWVNPRITR